MISTNRFPHARHLMAPGGVQIVSSRNQHTGVTTIYPTRPSWKRRVGALLVGASVLGAVVIACVGVML